MKPDPKQPAPGSGIRNPRTDPKPGDVWRIGGTEGIILRIERGAVVANHARFRDGRWQEGEVFEIGVAALWEITLPLDRFVKAAEKGQLLQRAEDFANAPAHRPEREKH